MKYTRVYWNNTLDGYKCSKGYIEVVYYDISAWGNFKKMYKVVGGHGWNTLREAKAELESL